MSDSDAATISLIITGLIAAIWYWDERVRRVPLEDFGMDAVMRVLSWEPDDRRQQILRRGWMTSHEWISMNQRQAEAINAELKRRRPDTGPDSK